MSSRGGLLALTFAAALAMPAASARGPVALPHVGLHAVSTAASSVTLAIPPAERGAAREIRFRGAGTRRWRLAHLGTGVRRWRAGGLVAGATYQFEVRVCRRGRCGRWSRPVQATTRSRGPGAGGRGPAGAITCAVFPADNPINQDVSKLSVDPNSGRYVASIGLSGHLHPDFGTNPSYGIPYTVVGPSQAKVAIRFTAYGDESDPGPYPVPPDAPVEGAGQVGDRHVLVVQNGSCKLYEMYDARRTDGGWDADSGAVFNLRSNALRPEGWTSADAAGLPIFPLLVRYDEVQAGHIDHALRFTVQRTQRGYIHPATHLASDDASPNLPPMGLRLRLKASYDLGPYTGAARVVLEALKRYGMFVADNGSDWFVSGASDPRWDDSNLDQLKQVPGSAFEVVRTGPIHH